MKAIQIKKFWPTVDKLKALYLKERDGRRKERLLAEILMHEVKSIPKVAAIIKRRRDTAWKWIKRFNQKGLAGSLPKKQPGSKWILTDEEMVELDKDLQKEPSDLG
nr:helix-turn-helix domain-containing protein [Candidatus Sigynarchaeum springense]